MKSVLPDGLYRVEYKTLTAGFEVKRGVVTWCAPALQRNFMFFERMARLVGPRQTAKKSAQ